MAVAHRAVPPTILSVSHDPGLLVARTQVLKSSGYDVIAALDKHVAILAAANHVVDLALLCYSIQIDEAEAIEHDLALVRPGLFILRLQDYEPLDVREYGFSPEYLLQLVRAALTSRTIR